MLSGEDWTEETGREAEKAMGYAFSDKALLKTCFTHKSWANAVGGAHNERLEFLGDAVLELCVTETLYASLDEDEGKLTERRKQLVSMRALERAERRAGLMRFLRFSGGENNVSGKTSSNLFEAVVAGIYLDGGAGEAKKFLSRFLSETDADNYKSRLQEIVQERERRTPQYEVRESEEGFVCTVRALGRSARGTGTSKKAAETEAAKKLCQILTERKEV